MPSWFPFADALHRAIVAFRKNHRSADPVHLPGVPEDNAGNRWLEAYDDNDGIFLAMGLGGEAGEVLNEFKKWMRGDYTRAEFIGKLRGELGDVQCMLALVARYAGLDLDEVTPEKLLLFEQRLLKRDIIKDPVTARPEVIDDAQARLFMCGNGHETQVHHHPIRTFACQHKIHPTGSEVCGAAAFPKVGT
jgi:NTP pyrophosphatase (non-canonical NTP hydrolase)